MESNYIVRPKWRGPMACDVRKSPLKQPRYRQFASRQDSPKRRAGEERICTGVAALVDTSIDTSADISVLVYRFDDRLAAKQKTATGILRRGIVEDSVRLPHQAIVEFVAAVTRPIRGHQILKQADALRKAEKFLNQFTVLYPNEAMRKSGHTRNTTACWKSLLRIFSMIGFMAPLAR
jgi:hypothetical protein